jgi:putative transposase
VDQGHRRSIRVKGFDYTTPGAYFVTVCVQNRACILGEVVDGAVQLSTPGLVAESWWCSVSNTFPSVEIDAYVIMPNHLHGILRFGSVDDADAPPVTLGRVMQWFKSKTTLDYGIGVEQYGWPPYPSRLWQRNYYEHIVRDEAELTRIRAYIDGNPGRWTEDAEYLPICPGFE